MLCIIFNGFDSHRVRKCWQRQHHGFNFHSRPQPDAFANTRRKSNTDARRDSRG